MSPKEVLEGAASMTVAPEQADPRGDRRWSLSRRGGFSFGPTLTRVVSLGLALGAWEAYGRAQEHTLSFAPLTTVLGALLRLGQEASFWVAFADTLSSLLIGLGLAIVIGIPLGILMGMSRIIGKMTEPYMNFLLALPMSTLVPIIVVAAGIGRASRILVIFLFAVFDIMFNAFAGMRLVDPRVVAMARSFNSSRRDLFSKVFLPSSLPAVMAGVRLGTGRALIGMVVAELLIVSVGVGKLINGFTARFRAPELFATILVLLFISMMILAVVKKIELRLFKWRPTADGGVE